MFGQSLIHSLRAFCSASQANVGVTFALALLPIVGGIGAAIDYSQANSMKSVMQAATDATALALVSQAETLSSSQLTSTAQNYFLANFNRPAATSVIVSANFDSNTAVLTINASAESPTTLIGILGINQVAISTTSASTGSSGGGSDNSCLLTLDKGQQTSDVSLTLNGSPNVNLTGCSIRSNTSMTCNGHNGLASASIAAGLVTGCSNPQSDASAVPDIYGSLASNITSVCAGLTVGITWVPGTLPSGPALIKVGKGTYTEYHICGDLTVSGSGYLTGNVPSSDSVIIIENGSLDVADSSSINSVRTAIVLTGNNKYASSINFPNGKGHASMLSLSPPTDPNDPWQGVSLYQDPGLTNNVDDTWGPGATFNADGVVYLPNANVVIHGSSASSNNSQCTKILADTLTTDGSVNLNFAQTNSGCKNIGMKQWVGVGGVRLIQ